MVKKIHYCWFGGKKLPKAVIKCINTWKKMLPDYEIKEWNETNFDVNSIPFVKEAYESGKWAFVSDYVRIYALYKEGGIYFDTDMKVTKDVSKIVDKEMFLGYEDTGYVGTAVIGVKEKNNKYIKEILDYYDKIEHFNPDIMYNYANPVIITKILKKYENHKDENGIRIFDNNVYIYPRDYFFPLSYNYAERVFTENTCMVHLFNATWADKGEKRTIGIYRKFGPNLGKTINKMIDGIFNIKARIIHMLKKLYNFARMKYSIYINRPKRVNRIKDELSNKKEEYLVICHPEMVEEKYSIEPLFKNNILELREQYTEKEASQIAGAIVDSGKKLVIFNSYADGWDKLMVSLKNIKRDLTIKIILHGSSSKLVDDTIWNAFDQITALYDKGIIDEFGFFKKSVYNFYKEKGYRAGLLTKYINIDEKEKYKDKQKNNLTQIGLYEAYDNSEKNIYNQLSAVSLFENVKLDCYPVNYKISKISRIYNINLCASSAVMTKEELYKKMANNDINLYITTCDDTSLLPLESLELGTVCLVGTNYSILNGSGLEEYIMVNKTDDIMEIYNKINYALENKEKILELYSEWKKQLTKEAQENAKKFLEI